MTGRTVRGRTHHTGTARHLSHAVFESSFSSICEKLSALCFSRRAGYKFGDLTRSTVNSTGSLLGTAGAVGAPVAAILQHRCPLPNCHGHVNGRWMQPNERDGLCGRSERQ